MHNKIAENLFGTIGTICWTAQLIPQVWKSYRTKSTKGLSHWLMLLWGISAVFQGVYALLQKLNIPLEVQPQIFVFLSFLSWGQCQYYGSQRSLRASVILTTIIIIFFGILELTIVLVVRPSHNRGNHAAADAFGIFGSILVSLALFPQYWEIYKYKEVIGISMVFIWVDIMGGVFNLLSLAFKEKFDAIAAVTYSLVVVLDGVIVVAAMILNPRAHKRRRDTLGREKNEESHASLWEPSRPGSQRPSLENRESSYSNVDRRPYSDTKNNETRDGLPSYTERDQTRDGDTPTNEAEDVDQPPGYEGSSPTIPLPPPVLFHQN
uniref:PQ-loop-domain-containing protein n=1 Tax=Psilocybe cubensis TaxID=181762 RepID=A0A8H7XS35_PSICU